MNFHKEGFKIIIIGTLLIVLIATLVINYLHFLTIPVIY